MSTTSTPENPFISTSPNFRHFCHVMTNFAENHLDSHRASYYSASRKTYKEIMKCYEEPRKTNEETDACAQVERDKIAILHQELNHILMTRSKGLEDCTDTCKDEKDMTCINNCGTQYMKMMIRDYDGSLAKY